MLQEDISLGEDHKTIRIRKGFVPQTPTLIQRPPSRMPPFLFEPASVISEP
jgi:hypothetical protein